MQLENPDIICYTKHADSEGGGFSFIFSGGREEVDAIAKRSIGWRGKTLPALAMLIVVWMTLHYGWEAGILESIAAAIGYSIFYLAQYSRKRQIMAGKAYEARNSGSDFLSQEMFNIFLLDILYVSELSKFSRITSFKTIQRIFENLGGIAHLSLSPRLYPTPFPLR